MSSQEDLGAVQLFAGFDDDEIDAFVKAGVRRSVPADHTFFAMGDRNSSMFVIFTGSVRVERIGTAETLPLATLEAGQTFGEMSLMDGSRTTASVTTNQPTEVLEVTRESLDRLLGENLALSVKLWRNFAVDLKGRLTRTNQLVDHYVDINQVLIENPELRDFYSRP
jgi:CRP/FNR family transcriptional regulator/CRP/FNR family cyclic AMP-dependent transcriptional regulator